MKKIYILVVLLITTIALASCGTNNLFDHIQEANSEIDELVLDDGWYDYNCSFIERYDNKIIAVRTILTGEFDFQNCMSEKNEKINTLFPSNIVLLKQFEAYTEIELYENDNIILEYEQYVWYDGQNQYEKIVDLKTSSFKEYKKESSNYKIEIQAQSFEEDMNLKDDYFERDNIIKKYQYVIEETKKGFSIGSDFIFDENYKLSKYSYFYDENTLDEHNTVYSINEYLEKTNPLSIKVESTPNVLNTSLGLDICYMDKKEVISFLEQEFKVD